jgi:hypothetical protein
MPLWIAPVAALAVALLIVNAQRLARIRGAELNPAPALSALGLGLIVGTVPRALDVQDERIIVATNAFSLLLSLTALALAYRRQRV